MNDVMTDVAMDHVEYDRTSPGEYSDIPEVDLEELFLAADSDLSSNILTWDGSEYYLVHLSIFNRSHLSIDTEVCLPEYISDNNWLIFLPGWIMHP